MVRGFAWFAGAMVLVLGFVGFAGAQIAMPDPSVINGKALPAGDLQTGTIVITRNPQWQAPFAFPVPTTGRRRA